MSYTIATAFEKFCSSLRFSVEQQSKISARYHAITKQINRSYWNSESDTKHSLYVGSFGRDTEIFASDVDVLVELPYATYEKFNKYITNGQSALLQEVKRVLGERYSTSHLKADGQIVSIPFYDGISFEVLPAFQNTDNSYTFANSNNGGSWKITDPKAEIEAIRSMNALCNNNLKRLCKIARAWKHQNDVDISGILLDILSYRFLSKWQYRDKSFLYYDWMTRDFMKYLSECPTSQTLWKVMGSERYIYCYGLFQSKAQHAYENALSAISHQEKYPYTATDFWRKIYGKEFPQLG